MTSRIKISNKDGRTRDRKTGRFLRLGPRVHRITVSNPDGWVFILDPYIPPLPPTKEDIDRWGEFA